MRFAIYNGEAIDILYDTFDYNVERINRCEIMLLYGTI